MDADKHGWEMELRNADMIFSVSSVLFAVIDNNRLSGFDIYFVFVTIEPEGPKLSFKGKIDVSKWRSWSHTWGCIDLPKSDRVCIDAIDVVLNITRMGPSIRRIHVTEKNCSTIR